jgi:AraC family transcriptional activator of pobA
MIHELKHLQTKAQFRLIYDESNFDRIFYGKDRKEKLLTITWNTGKDQKGEIADSFGFGPIRSLKTI